jgi:hypothetical protein
MKYLLINLKTFTKMKNTKKKIKKLHVWSF